MIFLSKTEMQQFLTPGTLQKNPGVKNLSQCNNIKTRKMRCVHLGTVL